MVSWYYRLQQRLSLTPAERNAIFVLGGLLLAGLAFRHLHAPPPVDPAVYAEADRLFAAANAAPAGGPALPDTAAAPAEAPSAGPFTLRVDLNRATQAELEGLPRVGPKTAARILAYRAAHGGFRSPRDLLDVHGIGEKTLARLAPHVYVGVAEAEPVEDTRPERGEH